MTWLLIPANVAVFVYGAYLALARQPRVWAYLGPLPTTNVDVGLIVHHLGSMTGFDLLHGEWWRLLTSCFVHFGLLHIAMNMYGLHVVGRAAESMWGHGWFVVIYLLSGLGGSCLGVAYQPAGNIGGASGALCGIVAAIAVWVLLNGRYLPRSLASRWRSGLLTTFILMVFISLFPNVSGAGHLGGALAGGAAALLLNFHRFGPAPWRWLALVGLAAIPWASFAALDRARVTSDAWHRVEELDFEQRFLTPGNPTNLRKIMFDANWFYQNNARPLLDQRPERRDPEAVERALSSLAEQGTSLNGLVQALARTGPYRGEVAEEARQAGLHYVRTNASLLELAERCLREGDKWTANDEKALKEQTAELAEARKAWGALLKK
jgi:membrane associated rhomboid family serine protease